MIIAYVSRNINNGRVGFRVAYQTRLGRGEIVSTKKFVCDFLKTLRGVDEIYFSGGVNSYEMGQLRSIGIPVLAV